MARPNTKPPIRGGVPRSPASVIPIDKIPDLGRGIIYQIKWGFSIGGNFTRHGLYVGLTSKAAMERFRTHDKDAKKYKFNPYNQDLKQSTVSPSTRLLYTLMRTSQGESRDTLYPEQYRYMAVLKEPNLFDLAYEEKKALNNYKTLSPAGTYNGYQDIVRKAKQGSNPFGLNSADAGSGNPINAGRQTYGGSKELGQKEFVMAAFLFILEGRGAKNPGRYNINYKDLAQDIVNVLQFFMQTTEPYESINKNYHKTVSRLYLKKDFTPTKNLINTIKKLGLSYSIGSEGVDGVVGQGVIEYNASLTIYGNRFDLSERNIREIATRVFRKSAGKTSGTATVSFLSSDKGRAQSRIKGLNIQSLYPIGRHIAFQQFVGMMIKQIQKDFGKENKEIVKQFRNLFENMLKDNLEEALEVIALDPVFGKYALSPKKILQEENTANNFRKTLAGKNKGK